MLKGSFSYGKWPILEQSATVVSFITLCFKRHASFSSMDTLSSHQWLSCGRDQLLLPTNIIFRKDDECQTWRRNHQCHHLSCLMWLLTMRIANLNTYSVTYSLSKSKHTSILMQPVLKLALSSGYVPEVHTQQCAGLLHYQSQSEITTSLSHITWECMFL